MISEKLFKSALITAATAALVACGGTDPVANDGNSVGSGPLLPLVVGNRWEYRVTDADSVVTLKRTTVLDQEPVGGTGPYAKVNAFKVVTRKGADLNVEAGLDKTESWQAPDPKDPARIVRYRELSYGAMTQLLQLEEFWDPPRIHADGSAEHTKSGAQWIETYLETKLPQNEVAPTPSQESDLWQVDSVDVSVDVPKGHFDHAILLKKTAASGGGGVKQYWYKRGVGKLKEVGSQTEELTDYSVTEAP